MLPLTSKPMLPSRFFPVAAKALGQRTIKTLKPSSSTASLVITWRAFDFRPCISPLSFLLLRGEMSCFLLDPPHLVPLFLFLGGPLPWRCFSAEHSLFSYAPSSKRPFGTKSSASALCNEKIPALAHNSAIPIALTGPS